MNKLENLLEAAKLNELVGRKIEEEKKSNKLVFLLYMWLLEHLP